MGSPQYRSCASFCGCPGLTPSGAHQRHKIKAVKEDSGPLAGELPRPTLGSGSSGGHAALVRLGPMWHGVHVLDILLDWLGWVPGVYLHALFLQLEGRKHATLAMRTHTHPEKERASESECERAREREKERERASANANKSGVAINFPSLEM